jgi:hypothetical protein
MQIDDCRIWRFWWQVISTSWPIRPPALSKRHSGHTDLSPHKFLEKYPLCDIFAMEDQQWSLAQETRVKMFGNEDLIDRQFLSSLEDS